MIGLSGNGEHSNYDVLTLLQSITHVSKENHDHNSSSSETHTAEQSTSSSNASKDVSSSNDQNEKEMTLGDALSQNPVKDESYASVEDLQNLAGGADIKVPCSVSFS